MARDKEGDLIGVLRSPQVTGGLQTILHPEAVATMEACASSARQSAGSTQRISRRLATPVLAICEAASERVLACTDAVRRHATCHMCHVSSRHRSQSG